MAQALDLWMLGKQDFSEFETFPTKKDVETREVTPAERKTIEGNRQRLIVGDSGAVKAQLDALCQVCNPDELLMIPLVGGFENRKTCVRIIRTIVSVERMNKMRKFANFYGLIKKETVIRFV